MSARAPGLIAVALAAVALSGCGSSSEATEGGQYAEARQARVQAGAQARVAHRQARIRARRQAQRAAVRQEQAERLQAESEEAEARFSEEAASEEVSAECDSNYSGCLSATASDYDCEGGSGDGPEYTATVTVTGVDHYGLDSDSDGVGCEP